MSETIWEWVQTAYARPGVESACLELQDQHGLNVCALLFALRRASAGAGFDPHAAVAIAEAMDEAVTAALRSARRGLKQMPEGLDVAALGGLRAAIKALELHAERLTLEALERLPGASAGMEAAASVSAVARAHSAWREDAAPALARLMASWGPVVAETR